MLVRLGSSDVSLLAKILEILHEKVSRACRSDPFNIKISFYWKILFKWSYCIISLKIKWGTENRNKSFENLTLYPYLIGQSKKHSEEAGQVHLSGRQLPSSWVVGPVQGCGTVHNQQCVPTHKTNNNALCGEGIYLELLYCICKQCALHV